MTYCAYCGAKMQETADACPVCGKWKRQVETPGGRATVKEPAAAEKTRIYTGESFHTAAQPAPRQGSGSPRVPQPAAKPAHPANASPARRQLDARPEETPAVRQGTGSPRIPQPVRRPPTRPQPVADVPTQVKQTVSAAADAVKTRVQTAERDAVDTLRRVQIPKTKLYAGIGFLVALVLVIVISASVASGSGAHGVVKKLAQAYEHQSAEEMEALSGSLMRALYPDTELTDECRKNIDVVRDVFSDRLGSRYRFSYAITLGKTYTGDELQTRLESTYGDLGGAFDLSQIEAMTSATLTMTARHAGAKAEKRIAVMLVKENGKWRLASQLA